MPIRVQLPNGSFAEFPDGMASADIEAVLARQFGAPEPPDFGNVQGGVASTEEAPGYFERLGSTVSEGFKRGAASTLASGLHAGADFIDQTIQAPIRGVMRPLGLMSDADPLGAARIADESMGVQREINTDRQQVQQQIGGRPSLEQFAESPLDSAKQYSLHLANAGAESLPAFAGAVALRNPQLAAGVLGGVTGAQTYTDMRADGVGRIDAARAGVANAAIEAAGESFGLPFVMGKSGRGSLMAAMAAEGAQEVPVSLAQTYVEDSTTGRVTPIAEQLGNALDAGLVGAGMGAGGHGLSVGIDALSRDRAPTVTPPPAAPAGPRDAWDTPPSNDLSPATIAASNAALQTPTITPSEAVAGPLKPAAQRGEAMADAILGEAKSRRLMADPILDTDALARAGVAPIVPRMEQPDVFTPELYAALGIQPEPTRDLASLLPESAAPPAPPPVRPATPPAPVAVPQTLPAPLDTQAASTAQPAAPAAQPFNEPARGQANPLEAGRLDVPIQPVAAAATAPVPGNVAGAQAPAVNSWVLRNKETGEVIAETRDRKKVAALNTDKYEAVPAGQHLAQFNEAVKAAGGVQPAPGWNKGATRENPLPTEREKDAPVGAWVAGPQVPGLANTRYQILEVPLDQIVGPEYDSAGNVGEHKRRDVERYADAMRNGEQFPNARGYELENGRVKLGDGHRRVLAARKAGLTTIRVAVSPVGDGAHKSFAERGIPVGADGMPIGEAPAKPAATAPDIIEGEAVRVEPDNLDALMREDSARLERASGLARDAGDGGSIAFRKANGQTALAGPDMSKPGGFRLTRFDASGQPFAHSEYPSLEAAAQYAMTQGGFDPATTTAPEPDGYAPPPRKQFSALDMRSIIGWSQMGGRMVRGAVDQSQLNDEQRAGLVDAPKGPVIGRTRWTGFPGPDGEESTFWRNRPKGITEGQANVAFDKFERGEPLNPKQQRFIEYAQKVAADYDEALNLLADEARGLELVAEQQDIEALREQLDADIAEADAAEAMTLADLYRELAYAGVDLGTVTPADTESNGEYAARLWNRLSEARNGTDQRAEARDSAQGAEGNRGRNPAAAVEQVRGAQADPAARQEVAPSAGLFGAPSTRDILDNAQRNKDAARDGRTGTGRTDMLAGDGELFAGRRPEQASVPVTERITMSRPESRGGDVEVDAVRIGDTLTIKNGIGYSTVQQNPDGSYTVDSGMELGMSPQEAVEKKAERIKHSQRVQAEQKRVDADVAAVGNNPVRAALVKMASGEHPERAMAGLSDANILAVAKAMGRKFRKGASPGAVVERIGEQARAVWIEQARTAAADVEAKFSMPAAERDLADIAQEAKSGPVRERRVVRYGQASEAEIAAFAEAGVDVAGFVHVADSDAIRHALKAHGNPAAEASRGQAAITPEDIARIPEIVGEPDSVEPAGDTRVGRPVVRYRKRIGSHFVVVEEARTGQRQLAFVTMWKVPAAPDAPASQSSAQTSETFGQSLPAAGSVSRGLESPQALLAELEASPVGRSLAALEKAGVLTIIHDPAQRFAGKWDGRKATLNAAQIPAGKGIGVALHELGVHAERDSLSGILGDAGFTALLATIDRWADSSDPATRDLAANVQRRVNNANTPAQHRDEERLAYAVELAANAGMESGGEIRAFLRRFAAYVKAWLSASKLGSALRARGLNFDLTPQDVAQLAAYAVARQARAASPSMAGRMAEAFSAPKVAQTDTAAFKAWAGKDAEFVPADEGNAAWDRTFRDGKPVVLEGFHGTGASFDVFNNGNAPTSSGKNRAGAAWFSNDPSVANVFAGHQDGTQITRDIKLGNSQVYRVFVKMRNPYIDTKGEYAKFGGLDRAGIAELEEDGYDGVIWPNAPYDLPDDGDAYRKNDKGQYYGEQVPYPHQYAVWNPTQVKSATANSGAFDPSNPSILASMPTEDARPADVARILRVMAQRYGDELFQTPKSEATALDTVVAEVTSGEMTATLKGTANVNFTEDLDETTLADKWEVTTANGQPAYVYVERGGDRLYIDASQANSGASGGSRLYAALFQYALNTGKVFIGDPNGLSIEALLRRTEHMLSAAIKHGTTRMMAPHPRQVNPMQSHWDGGAQKWAHPVKWGTDDAANIAALVDASYNNHQFFLRGTGGERVVFDFARSRYVGPSGEPVSRDELRRYAEQAGAAFRRYPQPSTIPSPSPAFGAASVARAGLVRAIYQGVGAETRLGFLGLAARQLTAGGVGESPGQIFYSMPEFDPATATSESVIRDGRLLALIDALKAAGADLTAIKQAVTDKSMSALTQAIDEAIPKLRPLRVTGIKNAVTDAERAAAGRDPILRDAIKSNEETLVAAMRELRDDPNAGEEVVARLSRGGDVSLADEGILLVYKTDLLNKRAAASDTLADADASESRKDVARQAWADAEAKIAAVDVAASAIGSEAGRMLQFRQRMLREDFTFAALERKERARLERPLTQTESATIKAMADTIAEMQAKVDALQARIANAESEGAYEDLVKRMARPSKQRPTLTSLRSKADAARARLAATQGVQSRRRQSGAVISPTAFYDLAVIGAYHVANGAAKFTDWVVAMRADIGAAFDTFKADHPNIFKASQTELEKPLKADASVAEVMEKIDLANITSKDVRKLIEALVGEGVRGEQAVIAAAAEKLELEESDVRSLFVQTSPKPQPTLTEAQEELRDLRKLVRLQAEIDRIAAGQPKPARGPAPPDSPAVAEKKRQLAELRASLKPVRDPEGRYQEMRGKQIAKRIKDIEDRIKAGDFAARPRVPRKLNEANQRAQYELDKVKEAFLRHQFIEMLKARSKWGKALGFVGDSLNLSRALMTSLDLSGLLRQGGFVTFGHPVMGGKAFAQTLSALLSDRAEHAIMSEIKARPNARLYEKHKLALTGVGFDRGGLSKIEENYASRWIDKAALANERDGSVRHRLRLLATMPVRASGRVYVSFLNRLRADAFDALAATMSKTGTPTEAEAQHIADFVNTATGRGKIPRSWDGLNTFAFAPRLVASRFSLATFTPIITAPTGRMKAQISKEYARALIGVGITMSLLAYGFGGDDENEWWESINFDPRSSDFMKLKFGETRIDPFMGLSQVAVLMARIATGETVTSAGDVKPLRSVRTWTDLRRQFDPSIPAHEVGENGEMPFGARGLAEAVFSFIRSKANPATGAAMNYVFGQNFIGEATTVGSEAKNLLVPMSIPSIFEAMEDQGVPRGTALGLLSLFGMSLQVHTKDNEAQLKEFDKATDALRDEVKERLSKLPKDQWQSELAGMHKEYEGVLAGVRLDTYKGNYTDDAGVFHEAGSPKVDKEGRPKLKYDRLSAENVDEYRANAGARPGDEAHHIIADNLVRRHKLMVHARMAGYDLNHAGNMIALPSNPTGAKVGHNTDHPKYDAEVIGLLNENMKRLNREHGSLRNAPPAEVLDAVRKIEAEMRKRIEKRDVPLKDGRLAALGRPVSARA